MIKNIVFDIGNVLVKWDPGSVVDRLFSDHPEKQLLTQRIFKSSLWYDLNLGKFTEAQAIQRYHQITGIDIKKLELLMHEIKESLVPIENSFDFLSQMHQEKYSLYALTDNVHEIVAYLKRKYDFWDKFTGVVISAEVGYLKPAPQIYQCLIDTYHLLPQESVFIDDVLANVEGARKAGMHGIQFFNVEQCMSEIKKL